MTAAALSLNWEALIAILAALLFAGAVALVWVARERRSRRVRIGVFVERELDPDPDPADADTREL